MIRNVYKLIESSILHNLQGNSMDNYILGSISTPRPQVLYDFPPNEGLKQYKYYSYGTCQSM